MRIALLNNRYFMVGGTTRYLFKIRELLESRGHTVIPFSNLYSETVDTPYARYFVNPPGGVNAPFFGDAPMTPRRALALAKRGTYDPAVRRALVRLIDEERIDIVYSINICNFLGPSVIDAARSRGIPYVMRLSDFNLICPAYNHVRDNRLCEECKSGLWHAVRHRCLQDSHLVSLARVTAMWFHRLTGIYGKVDRFVTPSAFLRNRLVDHGIDADRVHHVPTFEDASRTPAGPHWNGHEIVYSGRLSPEKGPGLLIDAFHRVPENSGLRLVFLGSGADDFVRELKDRAGRLLGDRVEFAGFLPFEQSQVRMRTALAVAQPSLCFENMPNSVTEAMVLARPVLASRIGSLPEQVRHRQTGILLPVDDPEKWAATFQELDADRDLAERLGRAAREHAERDYSAELHYNRLLDVFERAGMSPAR